MTAPQFDLAVDKSKPVRLKDQRLNFYTDEWYQPANGPDGHREIHTDTGETHDVDDDLLDALTTENATLTVDRLIRALQMNGAKADEVFIRDPQTGILRSLNGCTVERINAVDKDGRYRDEDLEDTAHRGEGRTRSIIVIAEQSGEPDI